MNNTPGPWWTAQDSVVRDAASGSPYLIADIMSGNRDDAILIAAAPDMYEALSMIVSAVMGSGDATQALSFACAAIAKAEGNA